MSKPTVADSWEGSSCHYVGQFRDDLDRIAKTLSTGVQRVRTRFDKDQQCAEMHVGDRVLAWIKVEGSDHQPCKTKIVAFALGPKSRALFESSRLPQVEFEEPLAP